MAGKVKTSRKRGLTGQAFDALPLAERERIYQELERTPTAELIAQSKPLSRADAALHRQIRRRGRGRPKIGKGSKLVAVTLELGLLEQADRFAKRNKMKRSEMIAQGLALLMAT